MATLFCLTKDKAEQFIRAIKEGRIEPNKLVDMTTEERRTFLADIVGEADARAVNTLFESKLLLKNQRRGITEWAKKVGGLKPQTRNDILAKIRKLDRALNPKEEEELLKDIVEQRLGIGVDETSAKKIMDLTSKMEQYDATKYTDPNSPYWDYAQQLNKFIRESSPSSIPTTAFGKAGKFTSEAVSFLRSVKTGLDLSASLRQGLSYFGRKEWNGAFRRMFTYFKDPNAIDRLEVSMMKSKYAEDVLKYKRKLGLTVLGESMTQKEEQFASKLVDKIPLLAGSGRAYTGFLNDLRFNRFVNLLESYDKAGIKLTADQKDALAGVIADATGRGGLGKAEGAANALSTALFSPRWLTSRFKILLDPVTAKGPARKEAIKSFATVLGIASSVLGLSKMAGGEVEADPRSSDFGKVKVGDTRFDVTAGTAPIITLLSRMGGTKSTTTGKVSELNTGQFGSQTYLDIARSFIENKTSPVVRAIIDLAEGKTFEGDKIGLAYPKQTAKYIADQLITPLLIKDAQDAFNAGAGMGVVGTGLSIFGISPSNYAYRPSGKLWDSLKAKLGEDGYSEAVNEFNQEFQSRRKQAQDSDKYKNYTNDEKNKVIDQIKSEEQEKIMKKYGIKEEKAKKAT